MAARSASGMTAPRPSIFSSCWDHCWRLKCCSVMRPALWQEVQAAFTLACIGPGGSGLPGALGAWALAKITDATRDAKRKIAGIVRCNTRLSPWSHGWCRLESPGGRWKYRSILGVVGGQCSVVSSQFSVLSSQFSVLRIWMSTGKRGSVWGGNFFAEKKRPRLQSPDGNRGFLWSVNRSASIPRSRLRLLPGTRRGGGIERRDLMTTISIDIVKIKRNLWCGAFVRRGTVRTADPSLRSGDGIAPAVSADLACGWLPGWCRLRFRGSWG
jgi:hypothetical protein